ncbi:MAG: hypothetical protein CSA33_03250 [Desulfobulbus propionicus]|nr:MAG: hypothetical protein CSA33_03250 [Desulfobulbus propionicus]
MREFLPFIVFWSVLLPAGSGYCAENYSMAAMTLKMGCALLIVVGLILLVYALAAKKFLPNQKAGQHIQILEVRPMMHKTSLALIKVHNTELLLAVSPQGIQTLTKLDSKPAPPTFAQLLDQEQ